MFISFIPLIHNSVMSYNIKFIISVFLFSVLVFLTGFILFATVLSEYFLPVFYLLVLYFMLLTIAGRLILSKTNIQKPGEFNTRYLLIRWGKVLVHFTFIIIYLLYDKGNILSFILTFLACYILYSIFDIYTLSFYLKKK